LTAPHNSDLQYVSTREEKNKANLKSNILENYYLLKVYELKFDDVESTVRIYVKYNNIKFHQHKTIPTAPQQYAPIAEIPESVIFLFPSKNIQYATASA